MLTSARISFSANCHYRTPSMTGFDLSGSRLVIDDNLTGMTFITAASAGSTRSKTNSERSSKECLAASLS